MYYRSFRKNYRSFRKGNRKSLAYPNTSRKVVKRAIRQTKVRRFKSAVRSVVMKTSEPKVAFTAQSFAPLGDSVANTVATYKIGDNIVPGDASYNRDGNELTVKGAHIKWSIFPTTDAGTSSYNTLRMLIWTVKPNARVPVTGNMDATYNPLGAATATYQTQDLLTRIPDKDQFTVFYDKTHIWKNRVSEATTNGDSVYLVEPHHGTIYVRLNKKYVYRDQTDPAEGVALGVQYLDTWPVFFSVVSDSGVAPHPEIYFSMKTFFKDL